MNGGRNTKNASLGYTIIEVLIFMAISGFMFVVAAIFINGKQAAAEYKQSMQDINSQVRTVINEVANGEYASLNGYTCSASLFGGPPVFTSGTTAQGANGGQTGCIFLGKVLQFNPGGDQDTAYNVYTIASRQLDNTTQEPVMSFAAALPVPVESYASNGLPDPHQPNLTEHNKLQNGLEVTGMYKCSSADCATPTSIGAVGFFGSFGSYSAANPSDIESGAQTVIAAVIPNSVYGDSEADMASNSGSSTNLRHNLPNINTDSNDILGGGNYALICFRNGNQRGAVSIGGENGQQFTTQAVTSGVPSICT